MKKDIRKPGWKISGFEVRGAEGKFEDEYVKWEYHQYGSKSLNGRVSRVELIKYAPKYLEQLGKECLEYCNQGSRLMAEKS